MLVRSSHAGGCRGEKKSSSVGHSVPQLSEWRGMGFLCYYEYNSSRRYSVCGGLVDCWMKRVDCDAEHESIR